MAVISPPSSVLFNFWLFDLCRNTNTCILMSVFVSFHHDCFDAVHNAVKSSRSVHTSICKTAGSKHFR